MMAVSRMQIADCERRIYDFDRLVNSFVIRFYTDAPTF
jgi:hypothetical protein